VGALRGCIGRSLLIVLVAIVAVIGWHNRYRLVEAWDRSRGREVVVSPELAALADEKLATLAGAEGERRVALTGPEIQSLIEYRWGGLLPQDVGSPRVGLSQGRVTLEARVATARFGRATELRDIMAFLPDTTGLRAVASFLPMETGHVGLEVHEMAASSIPIPQRLIPGILAQFPGGGEPGLPANAVAIPLPPGISTIFVSGDSMVFIANRTRIE
jgi:hypothetical protein